MPERPPTAARLARRVGTLRCASSLCKFAGGGRASPNKEGPPSHLCACRVGTPLRRVKTPARYLISPISLPTKKQLTLRRMPPKGLWVQRRVQRTNATGIGKRRRNVVLIITHITLEVHSTSLITYEACEPGRTSSFQLRETQSEQGSGSRDQDQTRSSTASLLPPLTLRPSGEHIRQ